MSLLSEPDYENFRSHCDSVTIEGKTIRLLGPRRVKLLNPPEFKTETTTLWSFPKRGTWATHRGNFRGNWAPQIPRNLVLRYTQPGETVLDQMVGGGTTLVECKLLGRNAIGVDINREALMLAMDRLNFSPDMLQEPLPPSDIRLYQGDARNLDLIGDSSVDLVATHPPYASIIPYTRKEDGVEGDLSRVRGIAEFAAQMRLVADECYRVLKPGRHCAVLVGDTRRNRHYVPIAVQVMQAFLEAGFVLKEDIIKAQWHTQTERLWSRFSRGGFLLIMHEHLFVFRKPGVEESPRLYAESMRWW